MQSLDNLVEDMLLWKDLIQNNFLILDIQVFKHFVFKKSS